jgi:hypothetical protein
VNAAAAKIEEQEDREAADTQAELDVSCLAI